MGSIPGPRRSHIRGATEPDTPESRATAADPTCCSLQALRPRARALQEEKPATRSLPTETAVAPAPRHWRKPLCSSKGPSQPKINKQINSRENPVIFRVVHHWGWIPGGSFHSLSWLIDAGRVDVCSCLMPPLRSGSAWGLVRYPQNTFLVFVLLLFPHQACTGVFSIEAVFMFQPCVFPWTLRWPSVCVESGETGGKAEHGDWERHPHPSMGGTSLGKGSWQSRSAWGPLAVGVGSCAPRPGLTLGLKSSWAVVALWLRESVRGCLPSSSFSLSLLPLGGQEF